VARAKLWAIQNKESFTSVISDLKVKVDDLEAKVVGASEQTLELFTTAKRLATTKLGAEVKLNNFVEARRKAAATLAVKRMQHAGLIDAWNVWAQQGSKARQIAVAEERIRARVRRSRLVPAMDSWYAVLRAARTEARAKAFALMLSGRRTKSSLKCWSSATWTAKWTENVLIARARMAELRGRSQCQLLIAVIKTWDDFTELESESSRASQSTAHMGKFVAC
jgi:hypothetical protein